MVSRIIQSGFTLHHRKQKIRSGRAIIDLLNRSLYRTNRPIKSVCTNTGQSNCSACCTNQPIKSVCTNIGQSNCSTCCTNQPIKSVCTNTGQSNCTSHDRTNRPIRPQSSDSRAARRAPKTQATHSVCSCSGRSGAPPDRTSSGRLNPGARAELEVSG